MVKVKTREERVARGVKLMNTQYGRWWLRQIDLEMLALQDGSACIIGQVEGEYTQDTLAQIGLDTHTAKEHGLDLFDEDFGPGDWRGESSAQLWTRLTKVWRRAIKRENKLWSKE